MQNLSLPNSTAQALLAARVDPSEVRGGACLGSGHPLLLSPSPLVTAVRAGPQVCLRSSQDSGAPAEPDSLTMQVYHLLWGPLPALDGKLGFLRKQEPWSRLGSDPLLRMEVRDLSQGDGWKKRFSLSYAYILGICGVRGEAEAGW